MCRRPIRSHSTTRLRPRSRWLTRKWYKRQRGYVFTYDGPVDTEQYSMEFALGMLPLTLPDERGRLALRDPAQGPMLDEALKLTQPSKKKGSKRTRGEEVLAEKAKCAREIAPPEELPPLKGGLAPCFSRMRPTPCAARGMRSMQRTAK